MSKLNVPINEIKPQAVHTIKHNPMLPEYLRAAVGLTNIPLPIITLINTLTAAIRPMLRLSPPLCGCSTPFLLAPETYLASMNVNKLQSRDEVSSFKIIFKN